MVQDVGILLVLANTQVGHLVQFETRHFNLICAFRSHLAKGLKEGSDVGEG